MSAVPELDKLLEDHEIFKRNIAWDRQERLLIFLTRVAITAACTVMALAIFGIFGIIAWPVMYRVLTLSLPYPARRDPFVRYKRL